MPMYRFEGMAASGSAVTGKIDAANEADAQRELRARGYIGAGAAGPDANGGFGGGAAGFTSLLNSAWNRAVDKAKEFAEDEHCCFCKEITVVLVLSGSVNNKNDEASLKVLGAFCDKSLGSGLCRKAKIPVARTGGGR